MAKPVLTSADEGALYQKNREKINQAMTDVCTSTATLVSDTDVVQTAIPGLVSDDLIAGKTYHFDVFLKTAMTTNGGIELCHNTSTGLVLENMVCSVTSCTASAIAVAQPTSVDAAGSTLLDTAAAAYITVRVTGSFDVVKAGNFLLTAAQNTSHADQTDVVKGSTMRLWMEG